MLPRRQSQAAGFGTGRVWSDVCSVQSGHIQKETNMRKWMMTAVLIGSMGAMPMIVGCDRTLHEDQKTTSGPNGQTTTDTKTVQHADGTVTTEKNMHANNP
jgi:hypothetical protein